MEQITPVMCMQFYNHVQRHYAGCMTLADLAMGSRDVNPGGDRPSRAPTALCVPTGTYALTWLLCIANLRCPCARFMLESPF